MKDASTLPSVDSFEAYENLKLNMEIFESAAKDICHRHQLSMESLTLFSEGTNIVFSHGDKRVIKLFPPLKNWKDKVNSLEDLEKLVWGL